MQVSSNLDVINIALTIDKDREEHIKAQYGLDEKALVKAAIRAINKAARWFRGEYLKAATGFNIPIKALRQRTVVRTNRSGPLSAVWFGLRAFDPGKLGKPLVRSGQGTKVGKDFIDESFPAFTRYNRKFYGVYSRKWSKERKPIIKRHLSKADQLQSAIDRLEFESHKKAIEFLEDELLK